MELACQHWPAQGPETAKIVLLHGMGGTGKLWRPVAAGLEDSISVLAPDQRGHGQSRVPSVPGGREPAQYRPLDYGQDLADTLEARGFHPVTLVGHSMGVRTAAALAHLRPEYVRSLVCVDLGFSGLAGGGLGDGLAQFLRNLPASFANRNALRESLLRDCPDPAIAQYLIAVSEPQADGTFGFPFDRAALIETIACARDASTRLWVHEAASRGIPVLVLRGARSLVWSSEEFEAEKTFFQNVPQVVFEEFEGAGHGLPFEKRPEFVARLKAWIAANPG